MSKQSAKSRAKDIFDSLDKDGDGELTMKEFVDGYLVMMVDAWKVPGTLLECLRPAESGIDKVIISVRRFYSTDRITFGRLSSLSEGSIESAPAAMIDFHIYVNRAAARLTSGHKVHYVVWPKTSNLLMNSEPGGNIRYYKM